jgi:hypothetical protein
VQRRQHWATSLPSVSGPGRRTVTDTSLAPIPAFGTRGGPAAGLKVFREHRLPSLRVFDNDPNRRPASKVCGPSRPSTPPTDLSGQVGLHTRRRTPLICFPGRFVALSRTWPLARRGLTRGSRRCGGHRDVRGGREARGGRRRGRRRAARPVGSAPGARTVPSEESRGRHPMPRDAAVAEQRAPDRPARCAGIPRRGMGHQPGHTRRR